MALLGVAFSPSARATELNRKTTITFSGPVEIPGVHLQGYGILPAGTYVFKVLDSGSDRHIVQIFSKDELTVYATILAIPNLRLKATDKTVMTFRERPAGQPEALRAWFYPGKEWGEEFVYPKARALVLAKETNTPVLFTPVEIAPEVTVAIKRPTEPVVVELEKAPVMAVQPSGQEVEVAQVITPVLLARNDAPTLPATGSSLPLVALFGMLALAGALSLGLIQKRAL
jgi:LPXTG-motif cell wall-anchored protein